MVYVTKVMARGFIFFYFGIVFQVKNKLTRTWRGLVPFYKEEGQVCVYLRPPVSILLVYINLMVVIASLLNLYS